MRGRLMFLVFVVQLYPMLHLAPTLLLLMLLGETSYPGDLLRDVLLANYCLGLVSLTFGIPFLLTPSRPGVKVFHATWFQKEFFFLLSVLGTLWVINSICRALPLERMLALELFLAAYGLCVYAFFDLLAALRVRPRLCQLVVSLVFLAFAAAPFYLGAWVEAYRGQEAIRPLLVDLQVGANPILVPGAAVFQVDLLKSKLFYHGLSPIGSYYSYSYPELGALLRGYLAAAIGMLLAGLAIRLFRRGRARRAGARVS